MFYKLRYHIYLLQLENFNLRRFIRAAASDFGDEPEELRNPIVWTVKQTGVVSLAALLSVAAAALVGWAGSLLFSSVVVGVVTGVISLIALAEVFFAPLAVATLVFWPADRIIRKVIVNRAKQKLAGLDNLTIIGITGSYGKTTMKQTLSTMLADSVSVSFTPDSFNTPVSVARFILSDVSEETDVFIVEMGAYGVGDIAELCQIARPDISVLTGINEAHRERFGSLENTIQAKFEIVTSAAEGATVVLNADDETVVENHERFIGEKETQFYSAENDRRCEFHVRDKRFHEDGTGISFRVARGEDDLGHAKVAHLADYIVGNVIAGLCVADALGLPLEKVLESAHAITPAEHRLQPTQRTRSDMLVIDDSYNGNPAGAHAAIAVLEKFVGRRTIYVTPGLVEMGEESEKVHKEIGEHLARVVDVVVLVQTSVTDWIKAGLKAGGFDGTVYTFESPQAMHAQINALLEPRDVLLFQNDWPENYR